MRSLAEKRRLQKGSPSTVVAHLLGHEGPGSVRSLLVKKGWANAVQAALGNEVSDLQVMGRDLTSLTRV